MSTEIDVLLTGDFHAGGRIRYLIEQENYGEIYNNFYPFLIANDLNITNLESPLTLSQKRISKTGPALKANPKTIDALKYGKFNLVTLANNHILDYGRPGLEDTIKLCNESGIKTVGAGTNDDEIRKAFLFTKNDVSLAIINVTENEFSTIEHDHAAANPLDLIRIYNEIGQIKSLVTYLILIIHGGHENYPLPSPRMRTSYRFLADAGADLIVCHHPHCFSGYEKYKESVIFYSLGNFLFDKKNAGENWSTGYAAKIKFKEKSFSYDLIPYTQNLDKAGIHLLDENQKTLFIKKLHELNDIINNEEEIKNEFEKHCKNVKKRYESFLEPYSLRILHLLRTRGFIPSIFSSYKKRLLLNLIRCESHREIVEFILQKK